MKNFIKKYMLKTLSCLALACAVVFSCIIGAGKPLNRQNENIEASAAQPMVSDVLSSISTVESSYNLMDYYPLTPENQTSSALCWAYSSSKALESALMHQAGEYYNFSEIAVGYLGFYYSYLDSFSIGGNIQTFEHIADTYGLVLESDFSNDKYFDLTTENYRNYEYVVELASKDIANTVDVVYFTVDNNYTNGSVDEKIAMVKKFVVNYGGLFAGLEAGAIYKDGSTWTYTTDADIEANRWELGGYHAVCLVGYDANGFIALNSWGAGNDIPYVFYIPYSYTPVLSTLAGFIYEDSWNVDIVDSSAEDFATLTKYQSLENVFCQAEEVEFTLAFDASINFSSVYVDAYKGTQEVSNAFSFDYDDVNRQVTITLTSGILSFEGGAYTFRVFESDNLLAQKSILIVSGTEIAYFNLSIDSMGALEDSEHFMHSYLSNDDSVTYYVRSGQNYKLKFYLTEFNKFNISDMNMLRASIGDVKAVKVESGVETISNVTSVASLNISSGNHTSNTYEISIKNLSMYKGQVVRIPLTINSNISGITAKRVYYINLVVSNNAATLTRDAYAVEYVLDGGLNSYENIDRVPLYATDTPMTEFILKAPTKIGENFVGWYLDKDFTIEITKISSSIKSDIVLYAKWEKVLVDYFDMSATISDIVKNSNQTEDDVVYGDDVEFEIRFTPNVVLSGYNYIVRYYFYLNGAQYSTEQIDKVALKANVDFAANNIGDYQAKFVVSVVISHNMSVSEERFINFEVAPKKVAFTFTDLVHDYDRTGHVPTVQLVEGSVYAKDQASFDFRLSDEAKIDAGTYDFSVKSLNNENYVISGTNACQLTIRQKEISISWDSLSAYYNKENQKPRYSLDGILDGDVVSISAINFGTMVNAGVYPIEIDANSVTNPNYVIANTDDIVFEIKPAEVVVTFGNLSCRVSLDAHNRPQITDKDYSIQGIVYQGDSLNLQIVCEALTETATEIGSYDITATYSNPNYNVTIVKGVYKLLGSYTVKYSLPNGQTIIEEVTEGEDPIGITEDIYKAGFFKKIVYSRQPKNDNGQDLDIVVTEEWDTKAIAICVGAVVVAGFLLYLIATRKARRNKVR